MEPRATLLIAPSTAHLSKHLVVDSDKNILAASAGCESFLREVPYLLEKSVQLLPMGQASVAPFQVISPAFAYWHEMARAVAEGKDVSGDSQQPRA